MRLLLLTVATFTVLWSAAQTAIAADQTNILIEKRTLPFAFALNFPRNVHVEWVYIYPSSIAFSARSGLTPRTKLVADFDDTKATYHRTVACTYNRDDGTFWVTPPRDVPEDVGITFRILPTDAERLHSLRKKYATELGILATYRKNPTDYSKGVKVLATAKKFFAEVDLSAISRSALEALLGPPDAPPTVPDCATYRYGDGEVFVIRQFHFDSNGYVSAIDKIPSQ
jgi:hypothetical protein